MKAIYSILLFLFSSAATAKSALILIDMQQQFLANADAEMLANLLKRQVELIEFAKSEKMPIIIVEFHDCGATHEQLKAAIGFYQGLVTIEKNRNGIFEDKEAGERISRLLSMLNVSNVVVSGINAGACVRRTIKGLLSEGYTVGVSADIVADFSDDFITVMAEYPASDWWKSFAKWDYLRQLFRLRKRFFAAPHLEELFACEQVWKK